MSLISEFERLVFIMDELREKCPWDKKQTHESLIAYLREESFEVIEAILGDDDEHLSEELGDLVFQVIFHAVIARERGAFDLEKILCVLNEKMERRHPHVFDPEHEPCEALDAQWDSLKAAEKKAHPKPPDPFASLKAMEPFMAAERLQLLAARQKFDWDSLDGVIDKMKEELDEFREAHAGRDRRHEKEELGDVFFSLVNLCRFLHYHPQDLLSDANLKFQNRYQRMRELAKKDHPERPFKKLDLETMEKYWQQAKEKD